jgi:hypothetical protein
MCERFGIGGAFYKEMFDAEVLLDAEVAGARNMMISIGSGIINFYEQPPKDSGRGVVHHLGIETDDLVALVEKMKNKGYQFRKPITDLGGLKYVMVAGPDNMLIELFQTTAL